MKLRNNIFVSSTFRDMHAERDMLHGIVIPELVSRFSKRHISIDLIDLRWGIDTTEEKSEQENTAKILKVCFDEIERSRPFFIGFIGERYGWIPNVNDVESAILGYGFDIGGREMSVTEMEMLYALDKFDTPENCLFFIRCGISPEDIEDEETRSIYFPTDPAMKERSDSLKRYLHETYPDNTFDYHCTWDPETSSVTGLEELCEKITNSLYNIIEKQIGGDGRENSSPLSEEKILQDSYLSNISESTFGREREIGELLRFADSDGDNAELVVSAPSGIGKSSLVAGFCKNCKDDVLVIPFFAGISERSSDFCFLARYLLSTLTGSDDDVILTLPYREIKKRLLAALCDAATLRRVVIVVDALDQFAPSRELRTLDFLDEQIIPKNVKIIYTTLPESSEVLIRRGASQYELLRLATEDVKLIASGIAARLHKDLAPTVLELIADKRDAEGERAAASPIYLVLLLELLCSFDSDDFAKINRSQEREGLTPAMAIRKYVERTILNTGSEIGDVLREISAKNILALGEKYNLITALLTSSPEGISERDIIGISALTNTPVTSADFSIYRRIFRIHLVEREGGNWIFNHAIIRRAQTEYINMRDNSSLYASAVKYYLSLPAGDALRCAGAIRFLSKLGDYGKIADEALKNPSAATTELLPILQSDAREELFEKANDGIFDILKSVFTHLVSVASTYSVSIDKIAVSAIKHMLNENWRVGERAQTLADFYYLLGIELLESGDTRATSMFELSEKILSDIYAGERRAANRALEISATFSAREEWHSAEAYAHIAYKQAAAAYRHLPEENGCFFASVTYALCKCIKANPLSTRGFLRGAYLARALKLVSASSDVDLAANCALEYLVLPKFLSRKAIRREASSLLSEIEPSAISPSTFVKRELYLARCGDAALHTRRAYDAATMALAESADMENTLLFARTTEEYLYRIMSDGNVDTELARDIMQRTDRAMKKLSLITSDVSYTDRRLVIQRDFFCFLKAKGEMLDSEASEREIEEQIEKAARKRGGAKRKKDVYTSLGIKLGAVAFLAYLAMQIKVSGLSVSSYGRIFVKQMLILLSNSSETLFNIIMTVMMFFGLLMIYSYEKRSYDYRVDNKSFVTLGIFAAVVFAVSSISHIANISLYFGSISFTMSYWGSVNNLMYSVVFSASITWFIAYAFNLAVSRPYKYDTVAEFRYRYRIHELLIRHAKLLCITLIPIVVFLPLHFYQPLYGADVAIDMFGVTPNVFSDFCYIPFGIQLILSGAEFISARARFGGNKIKCAAVLPKNRGAVLSRVLTFVFAVAFVVVSCVIAKTPISKWVFSENGYSVEGDYAYSVAGGKAEIIKYLGEEEEIAVPYELGGYKVTSMAKGAYSKTDVVSVTVHDGITVIPEKAFSSCKSLTYVSLPDGIVEIGTGAFAYCSSLSNVEFSGKGHIDISWDSFKDTALYRSDEVLERGYLMLGNNVALVDAENCSGAIHIPDGVREICDSMFLYAKGITELHLPDSLEVIGWKSFSYCTSLYYVRLPENLVSIEKDAFRECTKLFLIDNYSSIELTAETEEHGEVALRAKTISRSGDALCHKTAEGFVFAKVEDGYTLIAANEDNPALFLPDEYNGEGYEIYSYFLSPEARVYNLILPDGYEWYNPSGDRRVKRLFRVENGASSMKTQDGLCYFKHPTNVNTVFIAGYVSPMEKLTVNEIVGYEGYRVLLGSYSFAKTDIREIELRASSVISENAFLECDNLISVKADKGVYVGSNAFDKCSSLLEVNLCGDNITLSNSAFSNCDSLLRVSASADEKVIIKGAFHYCKALTEISLSGDVKITGKMFSSCPNVSAIDLGECTEIGSEIFDSTNNVERIYLSDKLSVLSSKAFENLGENTEVFFEGEVDAWRSLKCFEEEGGTLNTKVRLYIDGKRVTDSSLYELD